MAYDTAADQVQNPNTAFVQAQPDPAPAQAAPAQAAPQQGGMVRLRDSAGEYQIPASDYNSVKSSGHPYPGVVVGATPAQAVPTDTASPAAQATPAAPDFDHPAGATGAGDRALTVQSEPTPQTTKPPLDPRPYAWVKEHRPDLASTIDDAAALTGVSPDRIAWHAYKENQFRWEDAPRGADGEIGMMQIMPSTAKQYTMDGKLDPSNPHDNVLMGALYMRDLDARYGKDSVLSVAHYNGSGPKAIAYGRSAFPGASFNNDQLVAQARGGSMTPQGLVRAGTQGGPDGFFQYAVHTAPAGMPTSDVWRQAEATLVQAFVEKGDLAGAQHARDFVLQMSHVGTNQNLMAADQALRRGDGVGAANFLAKAHAFFPDGTIGRFRTDGQNVFAERMDENNPNVRLGPAMPVTANDVAGLLNQTTDPQKYLATLTEQRKAASEERLKQLHGDYYASLPQQRQQSAETRAAATLGAAQIHASATTDAAQIRANAQGNKPNNVLEHAATKDADTRYSDPLNPANEGLSLDQKANLGFIHKGAMMAGATGVEAERVARGLSDRTLQLIRLQDGNYGVVGANSKDQRPIGYLPKDVGDRLAPPPQQQHAPSPIGAGASTPMAMGMGVTNNLTGTVMPQQQQQQQRVPVQQSSALPVH